ncbi:alpha-L-arabinofuranosidase C-terminal domain-containing protein [Rhodopirellula sp. SWK7]|uniref:alpha-L-arabinofuranosidase C-terminal domain-containing protein n=1 Tax=Rhodopirellula sp. SWK7 TaxID=595460 RepID=UPI0005C5E02F|nr:alpha-L-arabinofuranosidase C-terminal domain-containing protein [Rhodopirellula sp. SWK7]
MSRHTCWSFIRWNVLVCLLSSCVFAQAEPTGSVRVHVDQPTVALPDTLYGLFYEDINYAADGGLYAELVQNRSFEYFPVEGWSSRRGQMQPMYAWETIEPAGSHCVATVEDATPLNSRNPHYLSLQIEKGSDGAGIANSGFDGIRVVEGDVYDFSFYAKRNVNADSPVRITLKSEDGDIGSGRIDGLSESWAKYDVSITAKETASNASLAITFEGAGVIDMDMVSLFPRKTFNGRKNGLRADLVQSLVDLKPAVFRFPGGCIAHGQGLDNAYRWKDTIGDVAERKPNWNLWGYHQTYGLGYFEYFLLCEDIGAEPLPILAVGVSCGFRDPRENAGMDDLQEWIDDAVDLVEFANGPVDSTWGKIRAEMGHPEPFNLKYVGLGNEDHHTPQFEERFPHFVRALRQQAPEIKIVGTSGLGPEIPIYEFMNTHGCDLSDEHYYESPEWFLSQTHRFDDFDRNKTKVFVGEYASKGNRLFNAVAEAAYLTGIERNADIVQMTAYAPLFARYGFTQWTAADLIWFDEKAVVRTPNYYVQQLFSLNKGDQYLANETQFRLDPSSDRMPASGRIGVGTWATQASFDDVKVIAGSETLFGEAFDGTESAEVASVIDGSFDVVGGVCRQNEVSATPAMRLFDRSVEADELIVSMRAKKTGGNEGFLVTFGHKPSGSHYWWNIGGWGNTEHGVQCANASDPTNRVRLATTPGTIRSNVWYDIRIEIGVSRILCYLDDQLIHDVAIAKPTISFSASKEIATGDVILKIVNPSDQPCPTQFELTGVERVDPVAKLTVLTGGRDDVNDRMNPNRVSPQVSELNVASEFSHTIAPMSVEFIRVRTAK